MNSIYRLAVVLASLSSSGLAFGQNSESICSRADVLFCEDWEDGNHLGWDWNTLWDTARICYVETGQGTAFRGTGVMVMHWGSGLNGGAGYPGKLLPRTIRAGETVYARAYLKFSDTWSFTDILTGSTTGQKLFYLRADVAGAFAWGPIVGNWPRSPVSPDKTNIYVDISGLHTDFRFANSGPAGSDVVRRGQWYGLEMMVKPSTVGMRDGHIRVWLNGVLIHDHPNVDTRAGSTTPNGDIGTFWIASYIGGPSITTPQQYLYWDNIVVAGSPIGLVDSAPPPPVDATPPTTPTNLAAVADSYSQVSLSWSPSTDNMGVTGYRVFRSGAAIATTTGTTYRDQGLNPSTAYSYTVAAFDAAGNVSSPSAAATVTTPPAPTGTLVRLSPFQDTFLLTDLGVDAAAIAMNDTLRCYTWPTSKVANCILMKFDLSSVPAGATIQDARLSLYLTESDSSPETSYIVSAHKVINKNPDLNRATGFTYNGTGNWTENSCCYNNAPMAQADIAAATDSKDIDKVSGFKTWNVTSLVNEWVKDPSKDYGLLLNADATKQADRYRYFASQEHADATIHPLLTVVYQLPPASPSGLHVVK